MKREGKERSHAEDSSSTRKNRTHHARRKKKGSPRSIGLETGGTAIAEKEGGKDPHNEPTSKGFIRNQKG